MSKKNRHRHGGGPPPGVPNSPRFKVPKVPKEKKKLDFNEWFKPIREVLQRGVLLLKPEAEETSVVITAASLLEKLLELAVILHTGDHPSCRTRISASSSRIDLSRE